MKKSIYEEMVSYLEAYPKALKEFEEFYELNAHKENFEQLFKDEYEDVYSSLKEENKREAVHHSNTSDRNEPVKKRGFKGFIGSKTTIVWANVILLFYEFFFMLSICGKLPGLETHFGGGLGDLLFLYILIVTLIIHVVGLFICAVAEAKTDKYIALLMMPLFPLMSLHELAFEGNLREYTTGGNYHGLYYNIKKVWEKEEQEKQRDEHYNNIGL